MEPKKANPVLIGATINRSVGEAHIGRSPKGTVPLFIKLPAAAALARKIGQNGALSVPKAQLAVIFGNSSSSSAFVKKIGVLKQLGLISEPKKDEFELTENGVSIAYPGSPDVEAAALKTTFLEVDVFTKLFHQNKGKILPPDEFLKNVVEQDCKIPKKFSNEWVSDFKAAAKYAGLLHDRGSGRIQLAENPAPSNGSIAEAIAQSSTEPIPLPSAAGDSPSLIQSAPQHGFVTETQTGHTSKIEVSHNRTASFYIPDSLTDRDIQKLKKALEGLSVIIESMASEEGRK